MLSLRTLFALLALLLASATQAQVLKDPQWQDWLDAGRTEELERAARARLAAQPEDLQAAAALALAQADQVNGARLDQARRDAQACIARHPEAALCHYAEGTVIAMQAVAGGALKAFGLANPLKNALKRATELDPLFAEPRIALIQLYLLAPGIAGGSSSGARELAAATEARQPELARVLRALIAVKAERWAEAERELRAVKAPASDRGLRAALREGWAQLGYEAARADQPDTARAREAFELLMRDWPDHAQGFYGMGRLMAQQGRNAEAVKLFEQARTLDGADKLPIDHRLGQALIAKGDKPEARRVLERYVASRKANPKNVKDARRILAELPSL